MAEQINLNIPQANKSEVEDNQPQEQQQQQQVQEVQTQEQPAAQQTQNNVSSVADKMDRLKSQNQDTNQPKVQQTINERFIRELIKYTKKDLTPNDFAEAITREYSKKLATFPTLYHNTETARRELTNLTAGIKNKIKTGNNDIYKLVDIESASPYSIFDMVFDGAYSDIVLSANRINLSDGHNSDIINIPKQVIRTYKMFLLHLIDNVKYVANAKFDAANAILDANMDGVRFNIIHRSINPLDDFPVVVVRRQLIKQNSNTGKDTGPQMTNEQYIASLGITDNQLDFINDLATNKSFIIFGTTGSGKTTLLKYMGNHNLPMKRNLITIEDTAELFIPVDIAMLTNAHYNIHDLFVATLRQNPSHCLIGESRTSEILSILEAGLTFQVGTTIHADSFNRAIERITFMSLEKQSNKQNIIDLIAAVVEGFIFMDKRKVAGIWRRNDILSTQDIYKCYDQVL